jgi:hypothetical protein
VEVILKGSASRQLRIEVSFSKYVGRSNDSLDDRSLNSIA